MINERIKLCRACPLSDPKRVYGDLVVHSNILFIGEAPGQDERRMGSPFVGDSGKIMEKWLVYCNKKRSDISIINAVKCMGDKNRKPTIDEMDACSVFLWDQIKLLRPEKVVVMGASAMYALLGCQGPIMENVGRVFVVQRDNMTFDVMIMPHPAYCLRNLTYSPPLLELARFLK